MTLPLFNRDIKILLAGYTQLFYGYHMSESDITAVKLALARINEALKEIK